MFAGLWFFLGVLQDIVAKDPLVILDIRLHNAVPLFRTAGMTRMVLAITELGGAAVLSVLCLGSALLALAFGSSGQPRAGFDRAGGAVLFPSLRPTRSLD